MSELEGELHSFISLPARLDESVRQPDVILAGTGSEVIQVSESKDMFLSKEKTVVRPEIQ